MNLEFRQVFNFVLLGQAGSFIIISFLLVLKASFE